MVAAFLLVSGALIALASLPLLSPLLPRRENYARRAIPTAAGIIFLPIILVSIMIWLLFTGSGMEGGGLAFLAYGLLAGLAGFADDVWGGTQERGFRGHLGALARGRVTTGLVKVVALVGGALAVGGHLFGMSAAAVYAGFLLAGSTNAANLFDLRPGRAGKFAGLATISVAFLAPGEAVLAVLPVVGGAVVLFKFDVRGRIMLGDTGAAVLGAVPGYLVVACGPGVVWAVAGVVILALTVVAEFSSISRVIEEVGALRWFDLWGRGADE